MRIGDCPAHFLRVALILIVCSFHIITPALVFAGNVEKYEHFSTDRQIDKKRDVPVK
ncbi:MAG TPA: hypothetical protein PKI76_05765 [Oscillospiraceae bacterium]|nr:hypothetical protein [Oscillospiraceae bacterium]